MLPGNRDTLRTVRKAVARWVARASRPLTVALVGALVGWGLYLGNQDYVAAISPTSCPAGCVTDGTLPVSSDPTMRTIENKIAAANIHATAGGSYYSVVLLDPFTFATGSTVSQPRMVDELRGAYLALEDANAMIARKHPGVAIQLLLANEGTSAEEGENEAVQTIKNLEGPDRIVAVAGMGLSTANTETAATALSGVGMPMFGAVTTGDQFNGDEYQGFFQIVPNVTAQVNALVARLSATSLSPDGLISSDQKADIYSVDLQSDFETALRYPLPLGDFSYDPARAEEQFANDVTTICSGQTNRHSGTATPQSLTILYAGRETTLPTLVGQFQQARICGGFTVTIVTGSDSNALPPSVTQETDPIGARVTVEYSDIENVASLPPNFMTSPLTSKTPNPCKNQYYDPWEVASYNSVMAAATTVSQAGDKQLTAKDVLTKAVDMVGDATAYKAPNGSFGFSIHGELQKPTIPIYTDQNGTCSITTMGGQD